MDNFLDLTEEQVDQLNRMTDGGKTNFANGYRYLYSIIKNERPTGDPAHDRQLSDLQYWLRNAPDVNENNPNSAANQYIRTVTTTGLRWDGTDSNLIGQLTQRRQIRLEKGEDTSWAEAPQSSAGPLPANSSSPGTYAYVSMPGTDLMPKNALTLYAQPAQAAPLNVNALNAFRTPASADFGNASAPGIGNALIPQADASTAADPYTATMLANMALMRAFGMAPSGGASVDFPQQP